MVIPGFHQDRQSIRLKRMFFLIPVRIIPECGPLASEQLRTRDATILLSADCDDRSARYSQACLKSNWEHPGFVYFLLFIE